MKVWRYKEEFPDIKAIYPIQMNPIVKRVQVLGKPVLVMRDTTKHPEGIAVGTLKLVGPDEDVIYQTFKALLEDQMEYEKMSQASNPYGDGLASKRIADILEMQV